MSTPKPQTFTTELHQAIERCVLDFIRKGDWLTLDYQRRIQVDPQKLREIYDAIDFERVKALCVQRAEERIADAYMNAMATEIATDTKQILSNRELREDIRAILRKKMRTAAGAVQEAKP